MGPGANAHLRAAFAMDCVNQLRITSVTLLAVCPVVPLLQPQRAPNVVSAAVGVQPFDHSQLPRIRQRVRRYGDGRFSRGVRKRMQSVVWLSAHPVVEIREETVQ